MTHVQVITKVWVDGELRASTCTNLDGATITAEQIADSARPAATRAADFISSKTPAVGPGQGKD